MFSHTPLPSLGPEFSHTLFSPWGTAFSHALRPEFFHYIKPKGCAFAQPFVTLAS
jgi:hypothetical protein